MKDSGTSDISKSDLSAWLKDQQIDVVMREFLSKENLSDEHFEQRFSKIRASFGDIVYSKLVHLLCHLSFTPEAAKNHLDAILRLRADMGERLINPVDLRVALMHYFLDEEEQLDRHKVVDIQFFDQIQESILKDDLTGLFNFRYLKTQLPQELHRAKRYGATVSVMIFDIDDFKFYNDQHGHMAGNEVLKTFAEVLQQTTRAMDSAVRYGGEEFVLILPATRKEGAVLVYERIQQALFEASIEHAAMQPLGVFSTSAGVATFPSDTDDPDKLLEHADAAMYMAKNTGKNKCHCYGQNRRSSLRVRSKLDGYFTLAGDTNRYELMTVDVSESGLLIETAHDIPVGALMDIHLHMPDGMHELPFPARVLRHKPGSEKPFSFALQLIEIPTQDRLRLQDFVRQCVDHGDVAD